MVFLVGERVTKNSPTVSKQRESFNNLPTVSMSMKINGMATVQT